MKLITGYQPFNMWQSPVYPNSTCAPCNSTACADCPFPGFLSGQWLPCNLKDGCKSIRDNGTYPFAFRDKAHWVIDCSANNKIGCLFNISADPTEHEDLSSHVEYKETLLKLHRKLKEYQKTDFNPDRGYMAYTGCMQAWNYDGYYGPFLDENGKDLFPLKSDSAKLPSCDLCAKYNDTKFTDTMCVHYPDMNKGFECTPFENGKCAPPTKKIVLALGRDPPLKATFLCGKGNYSIAENWKSTFLYYETPFNDFLHDYSLVSGRTDDEHPFDFPNMCKQLNISEQKPPKSL